MLSSRPAFLHALAIVSLLTASSALAAVTQSGSTSPSSGAAGVNNVNITASGVPYAPASITPADVTVTWFSGSCGGTVATTNSANSVKLILGSTQRFNVDVPASLSTATYYVQLSDSTSGQGFTSTNCSQVNVTASSTFANQCVAGSSLGVLLPPGGASGNVTAYVPNGFWTGGSTGIFVKNIEGSLGPGTTIPTAHVPNSCASNPATGETVCVASNTDVYLLTGTTLNTTLTSGSNSATSFSGGSCNNCGVAVNAGNNTAVINMGISSGPGTSGSGIQMLNLATNTFNAPFEMINQVSENITVDPTRKMVLSGNEAEGFPVLTLGSGGSVTEFSSSFVAPGELDSNAEDCATGIAFAPMEFTNSIQLVNFNGGAPSVNPYASPNAVATLSTTAYSFAAGLSGSAMAQGNGHLGVVTGEFGGNTAAVLQFPSTITPSATPSILDYAVFQIPSSAACGGAFSAGFDPHTVTAYTSPNNGKAYALFAGYGAAETPVCLALVDLAAALAAPRGGAGYGSHEVAPSSLPASAVTFFTLP